MPTWCADSWAAEWPLMPLALPILGKEQGPSGWMRWTATEKNLAFGNADHMAGDGTTAGIRRMQESSARVSSMPKLWSQLLKKDRGGAKGSKGSWTEKIS